MKNLIQKFKEHVITESKNENFIHHKRFAKYHLEVAEKLCGEICDMCDDRNIEYDRDIIDTLVRLHDYGKILDFDNQYQMTITKGEEKLTELGFEKKFIDKVIEYIKIMDNKMTVDLKTAPMEVQIMSSADGCAHFVGPFFYMRWYENPTQTYEELMAGNIRKAKKDRDRKIVLDFVKEKIKPRYDLVLEQSGILSTKFF